ncbi:MAG: LacI family DNA-binding transcriptional regulator [Planctomycetota bacterium]|jgi:LacI family transcriptional regulator
MQKAKLRTDKKISRRLLYEQLAEELKDLIARDRLWGGHLPPERELARTYGVSQDTVRRSLEVLVRDGLVIRRQGQGTRVLPKRRPRRSGEGVRVTLVSDWGQLPPGYAAGILEGLGAGASQAGWNVAFRSLRSPEAEAELLASLSAEPPAGLIIMLGTDPRALVEAVLQRQRVPIVLVDNHLDDLPVTSVRDDSYGGARQAMEHLLELGHTRIGFLDRSDPSVNPWRRQAYDDALRSAGIEPVLELVANCTQTLKAGKAAAERLLRLKNPATAILTTEDFRARGAWSAVEDRGLEVGEDVALASLGGQSYVPGLPVELTTLNVDWQEIGQTAVRELGEMMAGRPETAGDVLVPAELIVGRSTRAARVGRGV